ncbi:MAG: hypothetical protein KQI78_14525 [Deltaproteobacteria bacterium]|nr:hypothetical protein [Deltaproteobacteria bacterium]
MNKLYSMKWILHPRGEQEHNKLELYLKSLVDSGDLREINQEYVVTGKAITTIQNYEEEERLHVENVKLQRKMFWVTLILAFLALIQSGLLQLPTIIDWTGK